MLQHTQHLLTLMAQLRDPQTGCPWDVKQTFRSLTPYVLEEAYEVVDAIERDDLNDLRLELGDLLLQVVFHSQLASEAGLFDFEQVAEGICQKLIRRHPHVFANTVFNSDKERHHAWEHSKAQEREEKTQTVAKSVLDGITKSLPALIESEKIQGRAADHGFDWPEIEPVFDKVFEELNEVRQAWQLGQQMHIEEEVGDLLFVAVNLARHLNVNAETALKAGNRKFSRRFNFIEQQLALSDKSLRECSLAELDALWHEAKQQEI